VGGGQNAGRGRKRGQAIVTITTSLGRARVRLLVAKSEENELAKTSRQTFHMRLVNRKPGLRLCRGVPAQNDDLPMLEDGYSDYLGG
jgi:hypothetical protein